MDTSFRTLRLKPATKQRIRVEDLKSKVTKKTRIRVEALKSKVQGLNCQNVGFERPKSISQVRGGRGSSVTFG